MVDIFESAKGLIPTRGEGISGASIVNLVSMVVMLIILLVVLGIVVYFVYRRTRFNKRIIIFEKIGARYEPTKRDRATEVKIGTAGDTIFYTQKTKKYLPNPSIQTGRRTYWYAIREDGEWINVGMEDIDFAMRQVKARFLDKEMRYARTQIQRGLKERYDKQSFWERYGVLVMNIIYIMVLGVMMWLLFDKWVELAQVTNAGVETAGRVLEKVEKLMVAIENLCGGSGIRPA